MSGNVGLSVVAIVANVLVPGTGLIIQHLPQIANFLTGINGKCDQLSLNEAHFKRVSTRLHELLTQLTAMETKGQLPSVQVVKRYAELLDTFDDFLGKYVKSNFLCRLITQDTVLNKITVFHQEVDELLTVLNLAHIAHMTDWRAQYELDQKDESKKWTALLQSNRLLVEECADARKQREAMMRLLHAMHRPSSSGSQKQLVKQAFQALQRLSHVAIVDVPPWFVPPEDVSRSDVAFARGATASIFHGLWRQHTPVVVKCFDTASPQIEHEIDLWFAMRHPHVLPMYGACHVGATPFALCEGARTSLDQYSRQLDSEVERRHEIPRLLWEAALGVQHLHSQNVVHGDLKCNNLLVTDQGHVKVTDFGASFYLHVGARPFVAAADDEPAGGGGLRWMAPECIDGVTGPSLASDVYALGMCFTEAMTTDVPFADCTTDALVKEAIRAGRLPDLRRSWPDLAPLIASMCHVDPSQRPAVGAVVTSLHDWLVATPQSVSCGHCGSALLAHATFCHSCGLAAKPLETTVATSDAQQHGGEPLATPLAVSIREYGYALKEGDVPSLQVDATARETKRTRRRRRSLHLSTSDIHSMVANQEVESLVELLTQAREAMQEKALQALLNMASEAPRLVASGVLDPLVDLAVRGTTPTCKELAAALLGLLAFRRPEIAAAIREKDGVHALIRLLRQGTFVQRSFALRGLAYITDVDVMASALVVSENGLAAVCDMLHGSDRLKEHALWVLANVSDHDDHNDAVAPTELAQIVVDVEDMSYDQQSHALRLLGNAMDGRLPRKLTTSLAPLLVTLLHRRQHVCYLVRAIAKIAFLGDDYAGLLVDAGAIPLLWTLYQQHKSPDACLVALANLAVSDDCRCQLSRNHGLLLGLDALKVPEMQVTAAHLVHNLALEETTREWIVELGGVRSLLHLVLTRDELQLICLETLARLTLITTSRLDHFVSVVAWGVQQLVPRRRDVEFTDLVLGLVQNVLSSAACEEAFLTAGGIAVLLKLLNKPNPPTAHRLLAVLANVAAVRFESAAVMVQSPEVMYMLMTTVATGPTWAEKLEAMRCVANITYFEPSAMRAVKGGGISVLLDILAKPPRDESDPRAAMHTHALVTVLHLCHHPPFQAALTDDASLVAMLRRNADSPVARAAQHRLGIGRSATQSLFAVAKAKFHTIFYSISNNQEAETLSSPLVIQLQHTRTQLNALHAMAARIPHEIAAEDIVASGALDLVLGFLAHKKDNSHLRTPALRVLGLVVDHAHHLSQATVDAMLPPLVRIARSATALATDRALATEAAMTLACHGDRKGTVLAELSPETVACDETASSSLLYDVSNPAKSSSS
ncbi:Aste57867_10316 [Aphanomyces stellatus]|uniref:Aste57867_10316 protein n=1 Tax=Aphanomyces stellatus TaxID=120398 RepID=A0A485KQJ0_9STRA|nr:hypothetical protein As57867_010276 [Aphanomyces stellatus]VFT87190.1 Aste57867_10316 [Aphanomyces stellatus]